MCPKWMSFILSGASLLASSALGQIAPNVSRIATNGVGEVMLAPDWATMAIEVTVDDSSASRAASASAAATRRVVAALGSLGLTGDSVVRVSFTVGPRFDYQEQRVRGYFGRGTVRIEVKQLDRLAQIIDTALAVGATEISGLRFRSHGEEKARAEALKQAVAQARADAEVLAEASGGHLGRVLEIRHERGVRPSFGFSEAAGMASTLPGAPDLTRQEVVVLVDVETQWEFLPGRR